MNVCLRIATLAENILEGEQANSGRPISNKLADLFGCTPWSKEYLLALAELEAQHTEAQRLIEASGVSERSRSLFLDALQRVVGHLSTPGIFNSMVKHLQALRAQIDTVFLASDLVPQVPEGTLPEGGITLLLERLNLVLSDLADAEISQQLRDELTAQIELVIFSLRNFERIGINGVVQIFGGAAARVAKAERDHPKHPGTFNRLKWVFALVGGALIWGGDVVDGAVQLADGGQSLLEYLDIKEPESSSDSGTDESGEESPQEDGKT